MPSVFRFQIARALSGAILLSLGASVAWAQYPPVSGGVPYDPPPTTVIPRAGSIGRALTPPTYYRAAPQMVPTTVYRPVTAYHPVTGQPYTRWEPASTLDVETRRVETPLPGYGAPFATYRPAAPTTIPTYSAPQPRMNVQGWVDPATGTVVNAPPPGAYSTMRPALSVAPAYAVGRPVMGAPVVDRYGAWPRPSAQMSVQYPPAVRSAAPIYRPPVTSAPVVDRPVYGGPVYSAPVTGAPVTSSPSYSSPSYAAPSYSAPAYSSPSYSGPVSSAPSYSTPSTVGPSTTDPYYPPASSPSTLGPSSGAPADYAPSLRSGANTGGYSTGSSTGTVSSSSSARPLLSAQETERRETPRTEAGREEGGRQESSSSGDSSDVNWPKFLPDRTQKPAPASRGDDLDRSSSEEPASEAKRSRPAYEYDSETRPLRDPSRTPNLKDHRAPPLLEPRSAGVTAPIRRLTLTPRDNVTGHSANPAAR